MSDSRRFGSTTIPSYYQTIAEHEARSDPNDFMGQYERHRSDVSRNPDAFENDMRFLLAALM